MLDCWARKRVRRAGGAACAAAVARCACVLMRGGAVIVVVLLRNCAIRRFCTRSRLVASVRMAVGLHMGALMLGTLGTDAAIVIERVILLVSFVWGMGSLVGVCTLGACCICIESVGVAVVSS
jgi:hypothetical protein